MERRIDSWILRKKLTPECEERKTRRHEILEIVGLRRLDDVIRCDAAATVNDASEIGVAHIFLFRFRILVVVIVELRDVGIVALDQPSAGRVPLLSREYQRRSVAQCEDRLNQSLAEAGFADDQS